MAQTNVVGGASGAASGALAGAAAGSVVPVIGTAVGAVLGGISGALGGLFSGQSSGGQYATDVEASQFNYDNNANVRQAVATATGVDSPEFLKFLSQASTIQLDKNIEYANQAIDAYKTRIASSSPQQTSTSVAPLDSGSVNAAFAKITDNLTGSIQSLAADNKSTQSSGVNSNILLYLGLGAILIFVFLKKRG